MVEADPLERLHENLTAVVSTLVTGIWLVGLFAGQGWWLPFMLFGYVVLVPLTALLFGDVEELREWWDEETADSIETQRSPESSSEDEALETLRQRYARGELTEEQFERKLERLLETETLEDAEDRQRESTTERRT